MKRSCFLCEEDLDDISMFPFVYVIIKFNTKTEYGEYCSKSCAEAEQCCGPVFRGSRISKRKNFTSRVLKTI